MSTGIYLLIGLVIGGLLGSLFGWLYGRTRVPAADDRLVNELRQQLAQRETEIAKVREQAAEASTGRATAEARCVAAEQLVADQKQFHEEATREARAAQEKALADLRDTFKALSADSLKQTAPEFLRLANETFSRFQESAKG